MASYKGSLDLLALNGAKVYSGIDQENPKRAFVCVPLDLNEINVVTSQRDPGKHSAYLRLNVWPLNEGYKNAVRRSAAERGDEVNVPTHELTLSFTTNYIKSAAKQFPKLVEQVKEQNKERNPDIMNQDYNDETTHLFKAIRSRMCKRLALLFQPNQSAQQSPYPQSSYQQAGSPTAYVPPIEDTTQTDPFTGRPYADNELPF